MMPELTAAEIEEIRFRNNLQRANAACQAVAGYFRRHGYQAKAIPQAFVERQRFKDKGDVWIWTGSNPARQHVEVKRRNLDFTCAGDFPYDTINIDRVSKPVLSFMYVSTNRKLTHAAIVRGDNWDQWSIEVVDEPRRGYQPYEIYRCRKQDAEFVCLQAAAETGNPFFGHCGCGNPGLYWDLGHWYCNDCRQLMF
jgi:hypothetical protein